MSERYKAWAAANQEKVKAYRKEYNRTHKEKIAAASAAWYAANSALVVIRTKEWKKSNPDKADASHRVCRHRRRARLVGNGGSFTDKQWEHLKAQYKHQCLHCLKVELEIKLEPDHVLPVILGGSSDIENIQPLCHACNCSKQSRHVDYRLTHQAGEM